MPLNKKSLMKCLVVFCMVIFVINCKISDDGTLRDKDNKVISASKTEIAKAKRALLDEQAPKNLPASADGGVLFDGEVISVNISPNGLYTVLMEVGNVLLGNLSGENRITIYSPSPGNTGIDFKKGEVYRVFSVNIDGFYRTWDWLGTVKKGTNIEENQGG